MLFARWLHCCFRCSESIGLCYSWFCFCCCFIFDRHVVLFGGLGRHFLPSSKFPVFWAPVSSRASRRRPVPPAQRAVRHPGRAFHGVQARGPGHGHGSRVSFRKFSQFGRCSRFHSHKFKMCFSVISFVSQFHIYHFC